MAHLQGFSSFLDLLKPKKAATTSPFGPGVSVEPPKVDGKDGVPTTALGQQGSIGKLGTAAGPAPSLPQSPGGGPDFSSLFGTKAPGGIVSGSEGKVSMVGGQAPGTSSFGPGIPQEPIPGLGAGPAGGGQVAPPPPGTWGSALLPYYQAGAITLDQFRKSFIDNFTTQQGMSLADATAFTDQWLLDKVGVGTSPFGPLSDPGQTGAPGTSSFVPSGDGAAPPGPEPILGSVLEGKTQEEAATEAAAEKAKADAAANKAKLDAIAKIVKKQTSGDPLTDDEKVVLDALDKVYAQGIYDILAEKISEDSIKRLGGVLAAKLPAPTDKTTRTISSEDAKGVVTTETITTTQLAIWDSASQQFVSTTDEPFTAKMQQEASRMAPWYIARDQALSALNAYVEASIGVNMTLALESEQEAAKLLSFQKGTLSKEQENAIASIVATQKESADAQIRVLAKQFEMQAGSEEAKKDVKKGLLDIQKQFDIELAQAKATADTKGQIEVLREQKELANQIRENLRISSPNQLAVQVEAGQKFMSAVAQATTQSTVNNTAPLEQALFTALPTVPPGLVWNAGQGTFTPRPGQEGRETTQDAEEWIAKMTPVFQARDRAETALRQATMLRGEIQAQSEVRRQSRLELQQALADDDIDSAEEADVRRVQAETRLTDAQAKVAAAEIVLKLVGDPVLMGLARHYGVLSQIEQQLGVTFPGIPDVRDAASVPLLEDWNQMPQVEQGIRISTFITNGGTVDEFFRRMQAQAPGQAVSTRVRTL